MTETIGETAGRVWSYLAENRAVTAAGISKAISADAAATHQAIGWLAREGKLKIEREKRTVRYSLR